ncbi:MAG: proprotein convertase P-domain-containing protein, partial [Planctomycetota bacterium]
EVGTVTSVTIDVENLGVADLTLLDAKVGGADAGDFRATAFPLGAVGGAGKASFAIEFDPLDRGTRTAVLEIEHDATNVASPFVIQLEGRAADAAAAVPRVPVRLRDPGTARSLIASKVRGNVAAVRVNLDILHAFDADLDLFLVSPRGTRIELSTDNGGIGDDYRNTQFSDTATTPIERGNPPFNGAFVPEDAFGLAAINGQPSTGDWTLEVTDDFNGDLGRLVGWSLEFDLLPPGPVVLVSEPAGDLLNGSPLDFGLCVAGQQTDRIVTFENSGTSALTIERPLVTGPFTLSGPAAEGVTLQPGKTADLVVTLFPPGNGSATGELFFDHDGINTSEAFSIPLSGLGATGVETTVVPIPNNDRSGAISRMTLTDLRTIHALRVTVNVPHPFPGELRLELTSPAGTTVLLSQGNGGGSPDAFTNTRFDDAAFDAITIAPAPFIGSFQPEGQLSDFDGELIAGVWTLRVADTFGVDTGVLTSWALEVDTPPVVFARSGGGGGGSGGCSVSPAGGAPTAPWLLLLAGLGALWRARSRKRYLA